MDTRKFKRAYQYARQRIAHELPPGLFYHSLMHTAGDVIPALNYLAAREGVRSEPLHLLRTAAWFHDIGLIEQRIEHEIASCNIALKILPELNYNQAQIKIVNNIIMVTVIPQTPRTILEKIMADADLDVLGRTDFIIRNDDLRREFAYFGKEFTDHQWYTWQLNFLETHKFFTNTAHQLRNAMKIINIKQLRKIIKMIEVGEFVSPWTKSGINPTTFQSKSADI